MDKQFHDHKRFVFDAKESVEHGMAWSGLYSKEQIDEKLKDFKPSFYDRVTRKSISIEEYDKLKNQTLELEIATYNKEKARLLSEGEGKYVVISKSEVLGVWDTYEDAIKDGYSRCGLEPFFVKQILYIDKINVI